MQVAEIQGIYGPISISERIVQRIWSNQEMLIRDMVTRCGKRILVKHPGRWNLSEEGPDFKDAVVEIDGQNISGDIEIHLFAKDWRNHRHDEDPNFSWVCLHVVLFEPPRFDRNDIPTLVLGPYLKDDIEGYLLSRHENGDIAYLFDLWSGQSASAIRAELLLLGQQRWQQKLQFARKRLEALGFAESMHGATMEVLGYRRNRAAMADASLLFPLPQWQVNPPATSAVMAAVSKPWKRSGMRPANLPERRLEQYRSLWSSNPDWLSELRNLAWQEIEVDAMADVASCRKQGGFSLLRKDVVNALGGHISGTRLDTLLIDGWLPLISVANQVDLEGLWLAWYPGDFPQTLWDSLRCHSITDGRRHPQANVWNQGLLQSLFVR